MNRSHIATHLVVVLLGATLFKKPNGDLATIVAQFGDYSLQCGQALRLHRFKSDQGRIVLQVNAHRLTESDFRFDVTLSRWRP